jgi:hypothetical protein
VAEQTSTSADQYSEAIAQLRGAAKWLIGAFGAVGAALVAGIQLTQLGGVHHARLWEAVASVVVGVLGVALAIWSASNVLVPSTATVGTLRTSPEFKALRDTVAADPSLLKDAGSSLEQLSHSNEMALDEALRTYAELSEHPEDVHLQTAYTAAEERRSRVEAVVNTLLGLGMFLRVRDLFVVARRFMLAGALLAVAGALGFVYFANPPTSTQPPPRSGVEVVRVELTPHGRVSLRRILSRHCHVDDLRAVLLGGPASSPSVLTFPRPGCLGAHLHLTRSLGVID